MTTSKDRFLLDTQAFLWAAQPINTLSQKVRDTLLDEKNPLFLSFVSVWEMQIKIGLGKLHLPTTLSEAVQAGISELGIELLSVNVEHIYKLGQLPMHHHDPFDRLLTAQALSEKMILIGGNKAFDAYGVRRWW